MWFNCQLADLRFSLHCLEEPYGQQLLAGFAACVFWPKLCCRLQDMLVCSRWLALVGDRKGIQRAPADSISFNSTLTALGRRGCFCQQTCRKHGKHKSCGDDKSCPSCQLPGLSAKWLLCTMLCYSEELALHVGSRETQIHARLTHLEACRTLGKGAVDVCRA